MQGYISIVAIFIPRFLLFSYQVSYFKMSIYFLNVSFIGQIIVTKNDYIVYYWKI